MAPTPETRDLDCPEPLSVLNYAAALTKRVKLGTVIIILPLHHPLKSASSLRPWMYFQAAG